MNRASQAQEPSMEEILASIRRIISDDEAGASTRPQASAIAAEPAPQPVPAAEEVPTADVAADDDDDSAGNSQDDIDAMFAAEPAQSIAPEVKPEPEPEPESAAGDDIFDLTPDMRAPEPDADAEDDDASNEEPGLVEARDPDVVFREPEPAKAELAAFSPPEPKSVSSEERERLLSPMTDAAVSSAFSNLATLILSKDARTLEDLVKEMLRPLLKAWLDDNLPPLVERMVREEIERVSRGRR